MVEVYNHPNNLNVRYSYGYPLRTNVHGENGLFQL